MSLLPNLLHVNGYPAIVIENMSLAETWLVHALTQQAEKPFVLLSDLMAVPI